jgi:hypothetical protein
MGAVSTRGAPGNTPEGIGLPHRKARSDLAFRLARRRSGPAPRKARSDLAFRLASRTSRSGPRPSARYRLPYLSDHWHLPRARRRGRAGRQGEGRGALPYLSDERHLLARAARARGSSSSCNRSVTALHVTDRVQRYTVVPAALQRYTKRHKTPNARTSWFYDARGRQGSRSSGRGGGGHPHRDTSARFMMLNRSWAFRGCPRTRVDALPRWPCA